MSATRRPPHDLTVDDDTGIKRMLAAGVDSINSNFPEHVRRIVDAAIARDHTENSTSA